MKQILNKVFRAIKNPNLIILYLNSRGLLKLLPDKFFLKLYYRIRTGEKLDLDNPSSFNEKLQWLKLYDRNPRYTQLVDKYGVRNYIANEIGEEYLIPLIGVYDSFDEIDFNNLPEQFVIKSTHDSGGIVICDNKVKFDIDQAREKINKSLKRNYYYYFREWVYKHVEPRIVIEHYLSDELGRGLKDYKFFCFNGEPKLIQVDIDRFINHKRNLYTPEWNLLDLSIEYDNNPDVEVKRPTKLEEMLKLASKLAKDYPHVRVDFYYHDGKVYFGELTFFHGSGYEKFTPEKYNKLLGEWIELPEKRLFL